MVQIFTNGGLGHPYHKKTTECGVEVEMLRNSILLYWLLVGAMPFELLLTQTPTKEYRNQNLAQISLDGAWDMLRISMSISQLRINERDPSYTSSRPKTPSRALCMFSLT